MTDREAVVALEQYIESTFQTVHRVSRRIITLAERDINKERQIEYMQICIELLQAMSYRNYPLDYGDPEMHD
jgi:hypothetical protein